MSNFKNFEKAKKLIKTRDGLLSFFDKWDEKRNTPGIDKYKNGFCIDHRFAVFNAQVSFDCYTGAYGSSSCSTFTNGVDSEACKDLFKKAIEKKKHEIFEVMAQIANEEAVLIKAACEKELKVASEKLEEIKTLEE